MRVVVAIPTHLDSIAANAVNTFKMADGFARLGHETIIVCRPPVDSTVSSEDLRSRLALSGGVAVATVRSVLPDWRVYRDELFGVEAAAVVVRLKPDLAYCRAISAPTVFARQGLNVATEVHKISTRRRFKRMAQAAVRYDCFRTFVTIAPDLGEYLAAMDVPARKILLRQTGVDLALFARPPDRPLRAPSSPPRIVYSGHLFDYKGVPAIFDAAALMPDATFTLVGGLEQDVRRRTQEAKRRGLSNVRLLGPLAHVRIPEILWDADVLLLPPSARHVSAATTSPVKLGEYLASGSPIVATRIPALERLLTDREACLVAPDDGAALAEGIRRVLSDRSYAESLSGNAMERARHLGYPERAQAVLDHALGGGR